MLYAESDRSRQGLDVHLQDEDGSAVEVITGRPGADALPTLASRVLVCGHGMMAAIESMTGAAWSMSNRSSLAGKSPSATLRGPIAALAAKTNRIDARVLDQEARGWRAAYRCVSRSTFGVRVRTPLA